MCTLHTQAHVISGTAIAMISLYINLFYLQEHTALYIDLDLDLSG